jgi:dynein heavy chain 1
MYAGIAALELPADNAELVSGMHSREGENVHFETPVNVAEEPKINVWLGKVDAQM